MRERLPVEDHVSDEFLREVGLLLVTAAAAENALSLHLARLISHPRPVEPAAALAVWSMDTKVKLEKIAAVAHLRVNREIQTKIALLCRKIRRVFTRRNELAHFLGRPTKEPGELL